MASDVKIVLTAVDQASGVITKATGSLDGLNKSAINLSSVMNVVNSGMAIGREVVQAVDKAYKATVGTLMDYAKEVRDVARYTGTSAEESSKLLQIADDLQIETQTLKVGFRNLSQQGIQPTIENIKGLAKQYQGLKDPVEKAQFAMEMFGARSGMELAKMLELSTDEIDSMAQSAEDLGLVLDEKTIQATEDYRLAVDQLKDAGEGLAMTFGQRLLPVLTDFTNWLNEYIMRLNEADTAEEVYLAKRGIYIDSIIDERRESIELNTAIRNTTEAITGAGDAAATAAPKVSYLADATSILADSMKTYNMQTAYKIASEGLSAEASLQLAKSMGLVDEKSYALIKALPTIKAMFDENANGAIDAGTEAENYSQAMLILNERLNAIPDIKDQMDANKDGFVDAREAAQFYDSVVLGIITHLGQIPSEVYTTWHFKIDTYNPANQRPPGDWDIPRQYGGPVQPNKSYLVGEAGPELFVPNTGGRIVPNNQLGGSGGGNIIIHNHSAGAAALSWAMVKSHQKRRLQRSMGG